MQGDSGVREQSLSELPGCTRSDALTQPPLAFCSQGRDRAGLAACSCQGAWREAWEGQDSLQEAQLLLLLREVPEPTPPPPPGPWVLDQKQPFAKIKISPNLTHVSLPSSRPAGPQHGSRRSVQGRSAAGHGRDLQAQRQVPAPSISHRSWCIS